MHMKHGLELESEEVIDAKHSKVNVQVYQTSTTSVEGKMKAQSHMLINGALVQVVYFCRNISKK